MDNSILSYPVYRGIWINRSNNPVLGSTLTLTRTDGNLLIAFVAFFVAVVGTHIWRIACFALHWYFSRPTPQDAFHNQRQAILRNTVDPTGAVWMLAQLGWAWKRVAIVPVLSSAIFVTCLLTIASGFSSRVANGNEVLITSSECGLISASANTTIGQDQAYYYPWRAKTIETAAEYAQRCYTSNGRNSPLASTSGCDTFVQRSLPYKITRNASCPFDPSLCLKQDTGILLDTGLLDSHTDLGLNAPERQRFQYRTTLQCAPMVTEGFKSLYNYSSDRTYTLYNYGNMSDCNCTVRARMDTNIPNTKDSDPSVSYTLLTHGIYYQNGSIDKRRSTFDPISRFIRPKADVESYIVFLFPNAVGFQEKSPDDWYRATTPVAGLATDGDNSEAGTYYWPDEPAWPMGCVRQDQYCDPSQPEGQRCTPLSGLVDARDQVTKLFSRTSGLGKWIFQFTLNFVRLQEMMETLKDRGLSSRYGMHGNMQSGIEANQWQLDVQHWFETSLSALQIGLLEIALGPTTIDPDMGLYLVRPNSTEEQQVCRSQKIISTAHISFSVFGLFFIFVVGTLFILIATNIEFCVGYVQRRLRRKQYPLFEWRANYTLQLQRLAYEGTGVRDWRAGTWNVPVTKEGVLLAPLNMSDPKQPRFGLNGGMRMSQDTQNGTAVVDEEKIIATHKDDR